MSQQLLFGDAEQRYLGKTAAVVGAGAAGAVAAAFLANHGFSVKVYEKKNDPTKETSPNDQAYTISLRGAALDVLREIGVKIPEKGYRNGWHRLNGVTAIRPSGMVSWSSSSKLEATTYVGELLGIATSIVDDVRRNYSGRIEFFFGHTCKGVDFGRKWLTVTTKDGVILDQDYDLLVAADGENSLIRKEMQKIDKTLTVREFPASRAYKHMRGLPVLDKDEEIMGRLQPGYVAVVSLPDTSRFVKSTSSLHLFLYQAEPGIFCATLSHKLDAFLNTSGYEDEWSRAILPSLIPVKWKQEIAKKMKEAPVCHLPSFKKLSKLHFPYAVLIGYAGHSVSSAMGMGASAAISDGKYLDKALRTAGGRLKAVPGIYQKLRLSEAHALHDVMVTFSTDGIQATGFDCLLPFIGKLHLFLNAVLKKVVPWIALENARVRFEREEITAAQAMRIIQRDALALLGVLVVAVSLIVRYVILPAMELALRH